MGTRGYVAYRYKGKYYIRYVHWDAYPDALGRTVVEWIPRDAVALEEWMAEVSSVLLDENARQQLLTNEYEMCTDSSWTLGDGMIEWTYVIDLDNRALTVNGAVHFKLDNLPPLQTSGSKPGFADYLNGDEEPLPKIPAEYLTSIDAWSRVRFDAEKARQEYAEFNPTVVSIWGAPTWDTLSVPQHLSVSIVETLVKDYSDELALCCYNSIWAKLGIFCWKVANAAATAHLLCPPADASVQSGIVYVISTNGSMGHQNSTLDSATHRYLKHEGAMGRSYWFRGCLLTFCPRLDEPTYMTHKVVQMVQRLRKNDRTQGIGIIMSPWHLVTVAIDGSDVRHSPVLELHDGKEPKDGALLLIHLLSPTFTCSKLPWLVSPPSQPYNVPQILLDEILRYIIHFTDFDTYTRLPMVSHYFRSICFAYPRIGDYTLLSHEGVSSSFEHVFRVRGTSLVDSKLATLKRVEASTAESNQTYLWMYRCKSRRINSVLKAGLAGMFQYHQSGTGSIAAQTNTEATRETRSRILEPTSFSDIMISSKHPDLRVQVLDGTWDMVGVGEVSEVESAGALSEF